VKSPHLDEAFQARVTGHVYAQRLHGFKGDNGEQLVATSAMAGLRHCQTLIATRDRLYVSADGRVYAFAF
jgi:hypothetical protein